MTRGDPNATYNTPDTTGVVAVLVVAIWLGFLSNVAPAIYWRDFYRDDDEAEPEPPIQSAMLMVLLGGCGDPGSLSCAPL